MSNYQGPGRYRHYKGGEYEVLGLALREDSVDKDKFIDGAMGVTLVIYRPLTEGSFLGVREEDFWARELSDFNAVVWPREPEEFDVDQEPGPITKVPTHAVPRFQKIRAIRCLYFGTYAPQSGHGWKAHEGSYRETKRYIETFVPWGYFVDGKLYKESDDENVCRVHRKDGWTAIAFPSHIHDSRPGSNGNFFFDASLTFEQCVEEARRQWPRLMAMIENRGPLVEWQDPRGKVPA